MQMLTVGGGVAAVLWIWIGIFVVGYTHARLLRVPMTELGRAGAHEIFELPIKHVCALVFFVLAWPVPLLAFVGGRFRRQDA